MNVNDPLVPAAIRTVADVKTWLAAIHRRGLLWHMDDDPHQCGFDDVTADALEACQLRAIGICQDADIDIFELYPPMN